MAFPLPAPRPDLATISYRDLLLLIRRDRIKFKTSQTEILRLLGPPAWIMVPSRQVWYWYADWRSGYGLHVIGLEMVDGAVRSLFGNPLEAERRQSVRHGQRLVATSTGRPVQYRPMIDSRDRQKS